MKKHAVLSIAAASAALLLAGCSNAANGGDSHATGKPLTAYYPSTDKTKLGEKFSSNAAAREASAVSDRAAEDLDKTYKLTERLKSTVWYQTEEEYDDGRLERETEFLFFNESSNLFESEWEDGRYDPPDRDETTTVTYIETYKPLSLGSQAPNEDENIVIVQVKNTEREWGGTETEYEYQGYWLRKENNEYVLYMVDDVDGTANPQDNASSRAIKEVKRRLDALVKAPHEAVRREADRYLLSTERSL